MFPRGVRPSKGVSCTVAHFGLRGVQFWCSTVTLFRILAVRDVGSARALDAYLKEGERASSPTEKDADGFWARPCWVPRNFFLGPLPHFLIRELDGGRRDCVWFFEFCGFSAWGLGEIRSDWRTRLPMLLAWQKMRALLPVRHCRLWSWPFWMFRALSVMLTGLSHGWRVVRNTRPAYVL